MKSTKTAASLALLLANSAYGFRDQSQKKSDFYLKNGRNLGQTCEINHEMADSAGEVAVEIEGLPGERQGLFKVSFQDPAYSKERITAFGWCIDIDRVMESGTWDMVSDF